jgi:hypothetical protein
MGYSKIGVPRFDGQDYAFWSIRMKTYVQARGFDVWRGVVDGYKAPATPPTYKDGKKFEENYSRARNLIMNGLTKSIHVKVMHCESTKEIWNKPHNIYEGDTKVKGVKLQTLRAKFEQLKMKENEDIAV